MRRYYQGGMITGMKEGGSTVKNNKDKAKQLKKFMDEKRKGNFTGKVIKPRKDYKAKIVNPLRPDMELDSYDVMMEKDRKRGLRKALFNRIKAGGKGGRPGQWSARKAQMLAKQYKAKGGGYRG